MQDVEIIKHKLEDFEKDVLSINSNSVDLITKYENLVLSIYDFIRSNEILKKEYTYRLQYSFEISEEINPLLNQLREYSIKFWSKNFNNTKLNYDDFLNKTFSNYRHLIKPDLRYSNYNSGQNVFIPKSYDEFVQVINADELWFLYDIEHEYLQDNNVFYDEKSWRLLAYIDFACITDEDRLFGTKTTKEDETNNKNLAEYNKLTIVQPKELRLREFVLFNNIIRNPKKVFNCYIKMQLDYYKNVSLDDINSCLLNVIRELKYFVFDSQNNLSSKEDLSLKDNVNVKEEEKEEVFKTKDTLELNKKYILRYFVDSNKFSIDEQRVKLKKYQIELIKQIYHQGVNTVVDKNKKRSVVSKINTAFKPYLNGDKLITSEERGRPYIINEKIIKVKGL